MPTRVPFCIAQTGISFKNYNAHYYKLVNLSMITLNVNIIRDIITNLPSFFLKFLEHPLSMNNTTEVK